MDRFLMFSPGWWTTCLLVWDSQRVWIELGDLYLDVPRARRESDCWTKTC